jgi:hypothetical protein
MLIEEEKVAHNEQGPFVAEKIERVAKDAL